jgi:hypothetical protein
MSHYHKRGESLNALDLARAVMNTLEDKKGEDILLIDIKDIASFTDYFVICTATSGRMLDALAKSVQETRPHRGPVTRWLDGGGLRRCGCSYLLARPARVLQAGRVVGGRESIGEGAVSSFMS